MINKIIAGSVFADLTVIREDVSKKTNKNRYFVCRCVCGKIKTVQGSNLRNSTISCGCAVRKANIKTVEEYLLDHGDARAKTYAKEYKRWSSIKSRGSRGLGSPVCERWTSYKNFIFDMGRCPEGFWICRHDKSKEFSKENCFWGTPNEVLKRDRDNYGRFSEIKTIL